MPEPLLLSEILETRRTLVDPRRYPDETFASYSIPAYDEAHEPEIVRGRQIESAKFLVSEGTILIAKLNPRIKRVWRVRAASGLRALSSTEFVNVVPRRPKTANFISHLLSSELVYRQLERVAEGTTNSHVRFRPSAIENLKFPEIALEESWSWVADILTSLDEAIEHTEALIAKTHQVKAAMMHDLFTRGVTPDGQLRPKTEVRKTDFGQMPSAWWIGCLLDFTDPFRQPILTGPFGADLGSEDFVDEGVALLRIGNVQQGRLDLSDLLHVTESKASTLEKYIIRQGDLLFARQGATTGRNALATPPVDGALINYHIIRVALSASRCAPQFVQAAFEGEMVRRQIEREKGRGTREGINTAQLLALQIPSTHLPEQRMIARILGTVDSSIDIYERELLNMRQLKLGLMNDLLTGRVRVSSQPSE